jgi:uncharacterized SAM-binding protein YcdF (DUF218 family)
MLKTALGILTGILIFIAAGLLATYWIGKMRRDMEYKKPRIAWCLPQPRFEVRSRKNTLDRP